MTNYLLLKTGLGEVKKGFHELPNLDHIYGKPLIRDKFGAREVIGDWETSQLSASQKGGKNYIAMNREGAKQGCILPKDVIEFRKSNQMRVKIKQGKKVYDISLPNEDFAYGIQNRPSTPIKNVICNTYAFQDQNLREEKKAVMKLVREESKHLPQIDKVEKKKRQVVTDRKREIKANNYKLKEFQGIPSRVKPLLEHSSND